MKLKKLSLDKIRKLASALALEYTDKPLNIGLIGPMGAGKTTFTKYFCRALGIKKTKSPSFVVAHRYQYGNNASIHHLDFYRLHRPYDLKHLGLTEILNSTDTVIMEWVDKFPEVMKNCDLLITFSINPDRTRNVSIKHT